MVQQRIFKDKELCTDFSVCLALEIALVGCIFQVSCRHRDWKTENVGWNWSSWQRR
jgi:hypothetical protein